MEMFTHYLEPFADFTQIQRASRLVLEALPEEVRDDFTNDATFRVTLEDYTPETGWRLFMDCPLPGQTMSRCVVLRAKLETAEEEFARYIVAHEFAHAYLRNGGWDDIADPEEAADALAASWGFPRPALIMFPRRY